VKGCQCSENLQILSILESFLMSNKSLRQRDGSQKNERSGRLPNERQVPRLKAASRGFGPAPPPLLEIIINAFSGLVATVFR
jgi:hypothetical protein